MSGAATPRAVLAALIAICGTGSLAGCSSTRSDTVTAAAGDAMYHNRTVHAVDPWPSYAWRTDISSDGQRTARVIERYRTGGEAVTTDATAADESEPATP